MLPWLSCANPHSLHELGREAMDKVEDCRAACASLLGAEDASQIIFTSGATEANNWIAHLFRDGLAISPFEHSSMREPALHYGAHVLKNDGYSLVASSEALVQCVMMVNNETGAILSPPSDIPTHCDLTQAIGKVEFDLSDAAFASLSAHKFGGPKGIGLIFARDTFALRPYQYGGEQELGLRAGTLNVAGIVGMTEALAIALDRQQEAHARYETFRSTLLFELEDLGMEPDPIGPHSPAIVSLSFPGVEGETLVVELDALGFAISSGAACSSRSNDPSHVLVALGYEEARRRGTVRISFGPSNTEESARELTQAIKHVLSAF